jgi:tetratricopeptide (TPR) repeat protein
MDIDEGLEHALSGHAVLFTGAGFSFGAQNLRNETVKRGGEFADHLASRCGLPAGLSLEEASEEFALHQGDDRLIVELHEEFTAKAVASAHRAIASIPWLRIYTTNYDNVLETAAVQESVKIVPVTTADDAAKVVKQERLCVHLNGYVDRVNRANLWTELKLTDSSFATSALTDSPWSVLLRQDLSQARAVFFVGWALGDLDIRRFLAETEELKEKTFFVLGATPAALSVRRASQYGYPITITTDEFADRVTEKRRIFVPPEESLAALHSWRRVEAEGTTERLSDAAVFDLFLLGNVHPGHLYNSLHGGGRYVRERAAVEKILNVIDRGARGAVVYSGLGNGKTLLVDVLKYRAAERGFEVYELVKHADDTQRELGAIFSQSKGRTLIVIDNYPGLMAVVRYFAANAPSNASLVITARSSAHDILVENLIEILGADFPEFGVDPLTDDEVGWCVDVLDQYGLWGAMASSSHRRKVNFVVKDCDRQFHAVLLKIFESPQIIGRLNTLIADMQERNTREVFLSMLILSVINIRMTVDTLADLCGAEIIGQAHFRRTPGIKELIDFRSGYVQLRSAAAAEFILRRVAAIDSIVPVLARLAKNADRAMRINSPYYRQVLGALMRYSNLQHVLPDKGRRDAAYRYYEAIKNLQSTRRDPLFWLQYAIAALVFEDFPRAGKYFESAYAFAKERPGFNTFQIVNHYARFLLLRAARGAAPADPMGDFREARKIVTEQIRKEQLHYPFRVAMLYLDFFERFEGSLASRDNDEIRRAAESVLDRISKLQGYRRRHEDVERCAASLKLLLARM